MPIFLAKAFIYIIRCEENKYYIGFTNQKNPLLRVYDHFRCKKSSSNFVKRNHPVALETLKSGFDLLDEDLLTLIFMMKHEKHEIAGGSYVKTFDKNELGHCEKISKLELKKNFELLAQIKNSLEEDTANKEKLENWKLNLTGCFRCRSTDHIITNCQSNDKENTSILKNVFDNWVSLVSIHFKKFGLVINMKKINDQCLLNPGTKGDVMLELMSTHNFTMRVNYSLGNLVSNKKSYDFRDNVKKKYIRKFKNPTKCLNFVN